jgi:hypothetical protein
VNLADGAKTSVIMPIGAAVFQLSFNLFQTYIILSVLVISGPFIVILSVLIISGPFIVILSVLIISGPFIVLLGVFINKTDHRDITEILLKVALNTISPNQTKGCHYTCALIMWQ